MVEEINKAKLHVRKASPKKDKVLALYSQGVINLHEIARIVGSTPQSVGSMLRKNGIKRGRPKKNYKKTERNIQAKAILFEVVSTGKSQSQIAREYGVSRQYVSELYHKEVLSRK